MATKNPAASSSGSRRRILRIGVLLGGKIIEERLIRDRSPVSIGQSAKNTFSVPLENLPREWTLFAIDEGQYRLNFGPKMDGRVSDGAQVYTFDQVKGTKAQQAGEGWVMPLSDQARGKVSMGDLTLLFQFVTEPPVQPKPMLPASVRGTLAERIDPRLAGMTALSLVMPFGIALAAWLHGVAHLIELYDGAFPPWLAPVQLMLLPIGPEHCAAAEQVRADAAAGDVLAPRRDPSA